MADLSITATQVLPATSGATFEELVAGEAIDCGEVGYKNTSDGKAWRAKTLTAAEAAAAGIAVCAAKAAGQKVVLQKSGLVTLGAGAAPAVGCTYWASTNAGKIAVEGDIGSGAFVTYLGTGAAGNKISLGIVATAIAHA